MKKLIAVFATLLFFISAHALAQENAGLTKTETQLTRFIDSTNQQAVKELEKIVNINSGTMNFAGVESVANVLIPEFTELGFNAYFESGEAFGRAGHLIAKLEGGQGPNLLLIGHLDTVFELDSPFQGFELLDNNKAKGPGISDMKGGNLIILQALRALHSVGELQNMNVMVIMTGDEELSGKPLALSKKSLIEGAKWANIALGFEDGDGKYTTANISRRGSSDWTLKVSGIPAHSSQIFQDAVGAGAIFEGARILHTFYEELRSEDLLTFNPGRVMGGTSVSNNTKSNSGSSFGKNNVVAESFIVTGDIRGLSLEQVKRVQGKMRKIVAQNLPNTQAEISFGEGYPPLAPTSGNKSLLNMYSQISEELGQGKVIAVNPLNAGAADISFTAEYVSKALDGLGLSGTGGHTVNETADLNAFPAQSKRAAILMYRLKQQ
jgi:glutamate carboxypeptidase